MRTLILMPDWNSVLFWWDAEGQDAIDESPLPLSEGLKQSLLHYYRCFSDLFLQGGADECASQIDRRLLDDEGYGLWLKLRYELSGKFLVWFYSFEFDEKFGQPAEWAEARRMSAQ